MHYSALSTVKANCGLGSLGCGDTNKLSIQPRIIPLYSPCLCFRTLANVYDLVAKVTGYTNADVSPIPLTNITGTIPGALNPNAYVPYTAPDLTATGAGGRAVFVDPKLNKSLTAANASAPVNLTASSMTVPGFQPTPTVQAGGTGSSKPSPSSKPTSAALPLGASQMKVLGGNTVLGFLVGLTILLCVWKVHRNVHSSFHDSFIFILFGGLMYMVFGLLSFLLARPCVVQS